jgi:hypothetical protein
VLWGVAGYVDVVVVVDLLGTKGYVDVVVVVVGCLT